MVALIAIANQRASAVRRVLEAVRLVVKPDGVRATAHLTRVGLVVSFEHLSSSGAGPEALRQPQRWASFGPRPSRTRTRATRCTRVSSSEIHLVVDDALEVEVKQDVPVEPGLKVNTKSNEFGASASPSKQLA